MNKRILFTLLAAVALATMYLGPWVEFMVEQPPDTFSLSSSGFTDVKDRVVPDAQPWFRFSVLIGLNALLFLAAAFVKHEKTVSILIQVALMLSIGIAAFSFISGNSFRSYLGSASEVSATYSFLFFMPLVAFTFGLLANRMITQGR